MDSKEKKKIGAVLVQGSGIAGIQAALDLANSGFRVYLVEREAAIGGMMSHLDKTFPTGDCATCIVSPKLVECARNLNVKILTHSELIGLEGEPGDFKATILRHPGYVDADKCTACSRCTDVCPVSVPNSFDRNLGMRKAIAKHYPQATPNVFNILKNGHAPCKMECPAHINVQGYIQLIKKGEYIKAVNLIRERNPLSAICGRVCTHPCESACRRNAVDSPLAIRLLKRFASDKEMEMVESGRLRLPEEKSTPAGAQKVAVIGAGPAGLTAADDLAGRGFDVTVYEESPAAGGMLRYGIPEYRLPEKVLDYEIELIRRKGVKFVYNCRLGRDISFEKIKSDNAAVFLAIGAPKGQKPNIEGDGLPGVIDGTAFLRDARSKNIAGVCGRVAVIGGGNVAIDSARTALRLGAEEVTLIYRRTRAEMPASPDEVQAAIEENIKMQFLASPKRIAQQNGRLILTCDRMELGEPDETGRRRPIAVRGGEFSKTYDSVIMAIGQTLDAASLSGTGIELERGVIKADPLTLETSVKGVFAGGDDVSGPATVIQAVAAGKRAAESIARYIKGEDMKVNRFEDTLRPVPKELLPPAEGKEKISRAIPAELPTESRKGNFDEVEAGLNEEDALAESRRCLNCGLCSECQECVRACEQKAIDHSMTEETTELAVGAVILAPGFEEFDARRKGEFGYGRYPNVLTSVQFERMLSASGPFEGHIIRRSDGKEARRIAWIQCVGSRDSKCGNDYCSSICCMAATKQAMIAAEHSLGLKAAIFYMDIRAHGKDFDQYYERARRQGVEYIHSMPSRIIQVPGTKDMRIQYYDKDGGLSQRDFDLVVLSVGMEAGKAAKESARRLGIKLNDFGFCATGRLSPMTTSRPGVFTAGAFQEPKDIPETVTQASAAASLAMELLAPSRGSLAARKTYPDERDVSDEEPRIGVFICHCGQNIGSVIDVERVANIAAGQPGVALATHTIYTCSDTSLVGIREAIKKYRLNRIVVASCTPRTHEPIFRDTLREAGLNPYLFEMANIRDQCSWVHTQEPEKATRKAIELVKMAIARARRLSSLYNTSVAVTQGAVVIGGGAAGMTAALSLAGQGFHVDLIEKTERLGGNLADLRYTLENEDISAFARDIIERTKNHPNIRLHLGTEVGAVAGFVGNFRVTLADDKKTEIPAGAIIVATGAGKAETADYLYGQSTGVLTQTELEKRLSENAIDLKQKNIVMIQCAGSRNGERAYCSRICCSMAIKNALKIKKGYPDAGVYVLYRDIRTYGFRERYYKEARQAGVIFIRYEAENPPAVSQGQSGLLVAVNSPDMAEPIEIETDTLVLSTGVQPPQANKALAEMLKVPLNADGFFVEAHLKLRPVDFASEGIFLCGLAHSPKMLDENISQARAAAARAATVLSSARLEISAQVSMVDQEKCISCMTCVRACPYGAPALNADRKAEIVAAKCMGCGICAAECPARAIQLLNYEDIHFNAMIDELFSDKTIPLTPFLKGGEYFFRSGSAPSENFPDGDR